MSVSTSIRTPRLAFLALTISVFSLAQPALAQSSDQVEDMARQADANSDGWVTEAEIRALRHDSFQRLDRDGNNALNAEDAPSLFMRERFLDRLEGLNAQFDSDRNGDISMEEFVHGELHAFNAADEDGDGRVEVEALVEMSQQQFAALED